MQKSGEGGQYVNDARFVSLSNQHYANPAGRASNDTMAASRDFFQSRKHPAPVASVDFNLPDHSHNCDRERFSLQFF